MAFRTLCCRASPTFVDEGTVSDRAKDRRARGSVDGLDCGKKMERLRVGDVDCVTVKDEHFAAIRRAFDIADNFLDGTLDLNKLAGGGGKGGDLMTRTFDSKFFVKQLNGGDAKSLLRDDFLKAYVALVSKASPPS